MSFVNMLKDKGVKIYNVHSIPKASIEIDEYEELCHILADFKIDHVYLVNHYFDLEDMLITSEQFDDLDLGEDEIKLLSDEISEYNSLCQQVDYSSPITGELFFANADEKLSFYYCDFTNDTFVGKGIFADPVDALKSIIDNHESWAEEIKNNRMAQIETEKSFLKHALLEENEFRYCKNKSARYAFLMRMLDEKYGTKCPKLTSRFSDSWKGREEAQAFVDCLWEEYKNSGFQIIY